MTNVKFDYEVVNSMKPLWLRPPKEVNASNIPDKSDSEHLMTRFVPYISLWKARSSSRRSCTCPSRYLLN